MSVLIDSAIDIDEVKDIIERRLISPPMSLKYLWPKILQDEDPHWAHYYENGKFLLYFLDYQLLRLQNQFQNTKYGPLPGLFVTSEDDPCFSKLEGATNFYLKSNYCPEFYLLDVGKDCTVTIQ